ncbi:MAG TPA: pyridoxal 5'-phosphate synthase glutaminase subunit PdxT [Candidatus Baltobacteraceae bacterium]|jgi:5'-phosphate synthase pdxT subunit|nr:pyridoxal 5'-phosphate synthase glutaminase subunit PdxT [Candidatus Baltobacteraceae bacterium]
MPAIGVLALQGDVDEHVAALERAGATAIAVKTLDDLRRSDALVIPGGESTTVMKLLDRFELVKPIVDRVRGGMPLWGTCMGMIVAAHDVVDLEQPTLDLIDVTVRRNAFGRQNESAEVDLRIPALGERPFPAIFIRAPWIERIGPQVELLAERGGHGVMVRQGNVLATSFHPELTSDPRVHEYFLSMVACGGPQRLCRAGGGGAPVIGKESPAA